jgi:hypothetical protein
MRFLKVFFPAAMLMAGFVICTSHSYATPEFAKKEKKNCTFCHAKVEGKDAMPKNLTDAGKYYQSHNHSLDGYEKK